MKDVFSQITGDEVGGEAAPAPATTKPQPIPVGRLLPS